MHCYVSDMPPQSRRPDLNLGEDGVVGGGGSGGGGVGGIGESGLSAMERVQRLAEERAVVVFSISTCCMCHVVKRLLCGLGVNPTVHELDEVAYGHDIKEALGRLLGIAGDVPAVFVGGRLIGSLDRVMAAHISGALVPLLKEAGALWL